MKQFSLYIEAFLGKVYLRIIDNSLISDSLLSKYRIFVGLFFLLVARPSYSWLGDVPAGFYFPNIFTITSFFSSFPPKLYFQITDYLITVFLIFVVLGIKARLSFLFLFIIVLINNSFTYSFGKIDHHIISNLLFLALACSNSGTEFALVTDKKLKTQNLSLAIYAIFIVFGFFTAGLQKAYHWIDFDLETSGVLRWFYDMYFDNGNRQFLAEYFFNVPLWAVEIMDYTAAIFEVTGLIFLIYSRRSWFFYLSIASFFHFANTLFLNIPFITHAIVFGLWTITPVLNKKWYFGLVIFPIILVSGKWKPIIIWLVILGFSFFNFYKSKNSTSVNKRVELDFK